MMPYVLFMQTTKMTADELAAIQDRIGEMADEIRRIIAATDTQDDRELFGHLAGARTALDAALSRAGRMEREARRPEASGSSKTV